MIVAVLVTMSSDVTFKNVRSDVTHVRYYKSQVMVYVGSQKHNR